MQPERVASACQNILYRYVLTAAIDGPAELGTAEATTIDQGTEEVVGLSRKHYSSAVRQCPTVPQPNGECSQNPTSGVGDLRHTRLAIWVLRLLHVAQGGSASIQNFLRHKWGAWQFACRSVGNTAWRGWQGWALRTHQLM
jgi:hypothetical protein